MRILQKFLTAIADHDFLPLRKRDPGQQKAAIGAQPETLNGAPRRNGP
jgi:hypothetical protein